MFQPAPTTIAGAHTHGLDVTLGAIDRAPGARCPPVVVRCTPAAGAYSNWAAAAQDAGALALRVGGGGGLPVGARGGEGVWRWEVVRGDA